MHLLGDKIEMIVCVPGKFSNYVTFTYLHIDRHSRLKFNNVKLKDWYFVFDEVQFRTGLGCVKLNHIGLPHVLDPAVHPAIV